MNNIILQLFPDARVHSGYMRIRCPYHKDGKEKRPSMGILTEDRNGMEAGTCHCFTCGKVVTIEQLIADLNLTATPEIKRTKDVKLIPIHIDPPVFKQQLPYRFSPYLQSRGISAQVQERFKIYEKDKKVHMPVFNRQGMLCYSNARSTETKAFFIERNANKSLWGIEEIDLTKPIAICEGQIDAMSLWEVGMQAVATLGADNTKVLQQITASTSTFILAFDTDEAGRRATQNAAAILGKWRCQYLDFPDGIDVNQALQDINDRTKYINFLRKIAKKCE